VNQQFFKTMNMTESTDAYIEIVSADLLFRIRGIVRDFHFDSMKDDIEPLMLISNEQYERLRYLYVKHPEGKSSSVLSSMEKTWNDFAPGRTFEYEYLDDLLATRYDEEDSWGRIVGYSALLAILISSLGLFGLSLIIVNKRIREIGIRKVHGASVRDVLMMLNKSFITKIMLAFLLACPAAYFIMSKWLENFVYRTNIHLWIFLLAGAIVLSISVLTINWQCLKSARSNPVDSIKYE